MSHNQPFHTANPYQQNFEYPAYTSENAGTNYSSGNTWRACYAAASVGGTWDANWYPGKERHVLREEAKSSLSDAPITLFADDRPTMVARYAVRFRHFPPSLVPGLSPPPTQPLSAFPTQQSAKSVLPRPDTIRRKPLPADANAPNHSIPHPVSPGSSSSQNPNSNLHSSSSSTSPLSHPSGPALRSSPTRPSCLQNFPELLQVPHAASQVLNDEPFTLAEVIDHGGNRPVNSAAQVASREKRVASTVVGGWRRVLSVVKCVR
ncbi:hypothetical protein EK21DRAFT_110012 [Setomelanomma holmii]|uniref:Uncharacterized protein n=1 Tax=Setomelanomma holmii TaxID=210430 RepID=A0A9P4LR15_9PLEO|nr:hypothetical protein EK21DRAFT_110012 [Setomelanomma holmii]